MSQHKTSIRKASSAGFTLIEIALIITVSSLLLVTAIGLLNTWMNQYKLAINQQHMAAIKQALVNFEAQNSRLPCPASYIAKIDVNYSREYTAGCLVPSAPNTYGALGRGGYGIIIGAVPVRDLGLPDSYRADPYGYQYTYAVTQVETVTPIDPNISAINIVDNLGATVLPPLGGTASWVLVDHGKDGKGAFPLNSTTTTFGTSPSGATACASKVGLDQYNCNFETGGYVAFRNAPFSTKSGAATYYDDAIVYNTSVTKNAQTCTTVYSEKSLLGIEAGPGGSNGYNMAGFDDGGGLGVDTCVLLACLAVGGYTDNLTFGPSPDAGGVGSTVSTAPSPIAQAYCPSTNFYVATGGCSQTYGAAVVNAAHNPIAATASPSGNTYNGPIANADATHRGIYTGDLVPGSDMQIVMPPQSHPALPSATGIQGWECNGSNAKNMYTQAYAICCTGGQ